MYRKAAIWALLIMSSPCFAEQDVVGDLSTNIGNGNTVDSNNINDSVTNNYNATGAGSAAPVMSAVSPTMMGGGGNDSCLIPKSNGVQFSVIGLSSGSMEQDPNCNRRKDARLLGAPQTVGGLGLQVSGISIMCNDPNVFRAMLLANTPCPVFDVDRGALAMGKDAVALYRQSPQTFVVGYAAHQAFYDELLKIGQELEEDVQETNVVDYVPLSERFRSNRPRRGAGQNNQPDQLSDSN